MTDNQIIALGAIGGFFLGILIAILIENWPFGGYDTLERKIPNPPSKEPKQGLPKYVGPQVPPSKEAKLRIKYNKDNDCYKIHLTGSKIPISDLISFLSRNIIIRNNKENQK